jgi:hypothetical protein
MHGVLLPLERRLRMMHAFPERERQSPSFRRKLHLPNEPVDMMFANQSIHHATSAKGLGSEVPVRPRARRRCLEVAVEGGLRLDLASPSEDGRGVCHKPNQRLRASRQEWGGELPMGRARGSAASGHCVPKPGGARSLHIERCKRKPIGPEVSVLVLDVDASNSGGVSAPQKSRTLRGLSSHDVMSPLEAIQGI